RQHSSRISRWRASTAPLVCGWPARISACRTPNWSTVVRKSPERNSPPLSGDETASGPAASIVLPGRGAVKGDADGQAVLTESCELDVVPGRPCDLPGCAESTYPSLSLSRRAPAFIDERRGGVRAFGLEVHRDFCEVAIAEDGEVRSAGRVATRV